MSSVAVVEIQIPLLFIQPCLLISPTAILLVMRKKNSEANSPTTMQICKTKSQQHLLQNREHHPAQSHILVMHLMIQQNSTEVTINFQIRSGSNRAAVKDSVLRPMNYHIKFTWHRRMSRAGILHQTFKCNFINTSVVRAHRGLNRMGHIYRDLERDHLDTDHIDHGLNKRVQSNRSQREGTSIKEKCPSSSCTSTEDLLPWTKRLKKGIQIKEDLTQRNQSMTT